MYIYIPFFIPAMHIGFDAKRYIHNATGLGNYSRTLVHNLHRFYGASIQTTLYSPSLLKSGAFAIPDFNDLAGSEIRSTQRVIGYKKRMHQDGIQLFHGLSNELPLRIRKANIPTVVTIHDVIYKTFPKDFKWLDRQIYHFKTLRACKEADIVVAISEATKRDLIEYLHVPAAKIQVLYQSINPHLEDQLIQTTALFPGVPTDYMLYVGTLNYRKNILGILDALGQLTRTSRIPLVIVGNGSKLMLETIHEKIEQYGLQQEIVVLGSVDNEALKSLYKQAKFTILPSFYEGFGIPILESLFAGTPVITSNVSSLPEVAGNCGLLVDPANVDEIAHAIQTFVEHTQQLDDCVDNIPEHITKFTGKNTSEKWFTLYQSLL